MRRHANWRVNGSVYHRPTRHSMPTDLHHHHYRIPIRNDEVEGELTRKKAPLVIWTRGAYHAIDLSSALKKANRNYFPKLKPLEPVVILALDARVALAELTADL
jgi:hypothetical protein